MATEKTPLKIYRGINGTNTSSGSVPALQAGTLIFNEGLGFFTLDVNTSKATVSDAAKRIANIRFALDLSSNMERGKTDEKSGWLCDKKTGG